MTRIVDGRVVVNVTSRGDRWCVRCCEDAAEKGQDLCLMCQAEVQLQTGKK